MTGDPIEDGKLLGDTIGQCDARVVGLLAWRDKLRKGST